MTKQLILLLSLTCIAMTLTTCKKSLPKETQTGADTFGCFLNGELIVPRGGGLSPNSDCYYQHLAPGDSGYVFQVSGGDLRSNDYVKSITINVGGVKIVEGMTIPLTKGGNYKSGRGQCMNGEPYLEFIYYTNDAYPGYIHFSKFDETNNITSGTFAFKGVNSFGDTVNITEGRFDMHFTK